MWLLPDSLLSTISLRHMCVLIIAKKIHSYIWIWIHTLKKLTPRGVPTLSLQPQTRDLSFFPSDYVFFSLFNNTLALIWNNQSRRMSRYKGVEPLSILVTSLSLGLVPIPIVNNLISHLEHKSLPLVTLPNHSRKSVQGSMYLWS